MSNKHEFEERYKDLEYVAKEFYGIKESSPENNNWFEKIKKDKQRFTLVQRQKLQYCKDVIRNHAAHVNKFSLADSFQVEPSVEMIQLLEEIIKVLENPRKISDVWISKNDMYTAGLSDKVLHIMGIMQEKNFTHVPILDEKNLVCGVFSENTLFEYIAKKGRVDGIIGLDRETEMSEYRDYLPLDKHINETFKFVKRDTTLFEIERMFRKEAKNHKRIGMIFATENGKDTEKILGIITAWDIFRTTEHV